MDEEEFTGELEKSIPGRRNSLCNPADKREPSMSSVIPVALWGWSIEGTAADVFVYLFLGWVLSHLHQPPEGETSSASSAAEASLMFVT